MTEDRAPYQLTAPDPRDAPRQSLRDQISAFAILHADLGGCVQLESLIEQFIAKTKLAPALDGEPLFVLRAQDKVAPALALNWADEADRHEAHAKADGARRIAHEMIAWQVNHPARVKTPD